jgi:30S ribosomal protein S8
VREPCGIIKEDRKYRDFHGFAILLNVKRQIFPSIRLYDRINISNSSDRREKIE